MAKNKLIPALIIGGLLLGLFLVLKSPDFKEGPLYRLCTSREDCFETINAIGCRQVPCPYSPESGKVCGLEFECIPGMHGSTCYRDMDCDRVPDGVCVRRVGPDKSGVCLTAEEAVRA